MTTPRVVTDEQLGAYSRRTYELYDRVRKGVVPFERVFQGLQDLMEGNFDAIPVGPRRIIDCDATPYVPDGLAIESHVKGGMLEFDPSKIILHLEKGQKGGKSIKGEELRKLLEGKPTLNACVLDFLLANTALIPDSWKKDEEGRTRFIYFWDTVYRGSHGDLYVRCLCWNDGVWRRYYRWLDRHWDDQRPAALAS